MDLAARGVEAHLQLHPALERALLEVGRQVRVVANGLAVGREAEVLAEGHGKTSIGKRDLLPKVGASVTWKGGDIYEGA